MEHWEKLAPGGLRLLWDDALFPPGTDSFLLSALPRPRPGLRVCDLGCGTGLVGFLLLQRQRDLSLTGVDREERAIALARRCAAENGLADRAVFETLDIRDLRGRLPAGGFDLVVSNPPYFPPSRGLSPADPARRQARTEDTLSLPELCRAAGYLLRWGGSFCLVHRPERLADLLTALREAGLEPKRLRAVEPRPGAVPSLLLLEARRGGRPGLAWEAPLRLTDAHGAPTPELDAIYFRSTEDTIL